ncbi:BnaC05g24040D [Brassica napus]|uniref:CDP-diacylglycerol--serine O-phosphatidyltransferase n=1 Tax=Brassica napus TaxID=3708 RepID=A0A078GB40_BRANA|nr:BnaC05g24040D [Brassica napus]
MKQTKIQHSVQIERVMKRSSFGHKMRQSFYDITNSQTQKMSLIFKKPVKALHHEVTCKNALLKAKCSEQEGFGLECVQYAIFDGPTYEWAVISRQPNLIGKTLWQFTPVRWDKDEWHPLQAAWHVIQVLTLCIIFLTVALNTLFLKFSMWIPSTNPLILYSLILWLLIARAEALESDYVFDESSGYYYSSRLSRWQRL